MGIKKAIVVLAATEAVKAPILNNRIKRIVGQQPTPQQADPPNMTYGVCPANNTGPIIGGVQHEWGQFSSITDEEIAEKYRGIARWEAAHWAWRCRRAKRILLKILLPIPLLLIHWPDDPEPERSQYYRDLGLR